MQIRGSEIHPTSVNAQCARLWTKALINNAYHYIIIYFKELLEQLINIFRM